MAQATHVAIADPSGQSEALAARLHVFTGADDDNAANAYEPADRLTSIAHAFPTSSDNVTLGYGYDAAGRELTRATSNSQHLQPPVMASVPYSAANALNQYLSVNAHPYAWWPEGLVMQTDQVAPPHQHIGWDRAAMFSKRLRTTEKSIRAGRV